jgi:hypothetical protein
MVSLMKCIAAVCTSIHCLVSMVSVQMTSTLQSLLAGQDCVNDDMQCISQCSVEFGLFALSLAQLTSSFLFVLLDWIWGGLDVAMVKDYFINFSLDTHEGGQLVAEGDQ